MATSGLPFYSWHGSTELCRLGSSSQGNLFLLTSVEGSLLLGSEAVLPCAQGMQHPLTIVKGKLQRNGLQVHELLLDYSWRRSMERKQYSHENQELVCVMNLKSSPFSLLHAVITFICKNSGKLGGHSLLLPFLGDLHYDYSNGTRMKVWFSENSQYLLEFIIPGFIIISVSFDWTLDKYVYWSQLSLLKLIVSIHHILGTGP